MTVEQILTMLMALLPSIISVISMIVSVVKMLSANKVNGKKLLEKMEEVYAAASDKKEYNELKARYDELVDQLMIVHKENIELKKTQNKLLTEFDKIIRTEE